MTSQAQPQKSKITASRDCDNGNQKSMYNLSGVSHRRRMVKRNMSASSLLHMVPRKWGSLPPIEVTTVAEEDASSGLYSRKSPLSESSGSNPSGVSDPVPDESVSTAIVTDLSSEDSRCSSCSTVGATGDSLESSEESGAVARDDIYEDLSGNSRLMDSSSEPNSKPSGSSLLLGGELGAATAMTAAGHSTYFPELTPTHGPVGSSRPQLHILKPLAVNTPFELPRAGNYSANPTAKAKEYLLKNAGVLSSTVSIIDAWLPIFLMK